MDKIIIETHTGMTDILSHPTNGLHKNLNRWNDHEF